MCGTALRLLLTLGTLAGACAWRAQAGSFAAHPSAAFNAPRFRALTMAETDPIIDKEQDTSTDEPAAAPPAEASTPSSAPAPMYDLNKVQDSSGAGFNQFDPVLSLSGFLSRRFGILGGLGLVALLAATEGNEIFRAATDRGPVAGSGELVTTASGLQYADILIGSSGDSPLPGSVVGFKAKVFIGDKVLYDTGDSKPVAFKFGQRPFQSVICEGVEEGLKGMKPGGKRKLIVPATLAPKGVDLPPGVPLVYEVELTEVLPGYF